jgi:hypothetical protein
MPVRDDLGTRMKTFYEQIPKTKLMRRTPVAIRIDGKAFHTFTRGFKKPFDTILVKTMQETTKYLCENEDYLDEIRNGNIVCEGISVEEIKRTMQKD